MARGPVSLTHGTYTMLGPVSSLNGRVFDEDPIITYMLMDMPREERLEYLPTYWYKLGKSALMNDAVITEADGWKAGAIVVPPGKHVENVWTLFSAGFLGVLWRIGFSGLKRLWTEFSGFTDHAKKVGLRGRKKYYYIVSIGTERAHRGKGLAKAIMRHYQEKARVDNLPIWLEATTANSRNLYLSLGFQEIEEITLGKGKVAADATPTPGGSGVTLWAMVWWPESGIQSSESDSRSP